MSEVSPSQADTSPCHCLLFQPQKRNELQLPVLRITQFNSHLSYSYLLSWSAQSCLLSWRKKKCWAEMYRNVRVILCVVMPTFPNLCSSRSKSTYTALDQSLWVSSSWNPELSLSENSSTLAQANLFHRFSTCRVKRISSFPVCIFCLKLSWAFLAPSPGSQRNITHCSLPDLILHTGECLLYSP